MSATAPRPVGQDCIPVGQAAPALEIPSRFGFAETVAVLERTIVDAGMNLFAKIDHRAAARSAGLEMPPTMLLFFGNAAKGTPLMIAAPATALDLPLRVLIRKNAAGEVVVSRPPVAAILAKSGAAKDQAEGLEGALRRVIETVEPFVD